MRDPKAEARRGALGAATELLRAHYDRVAAEPVPQALTEMLAKLPADGPRKAEP